MALYPFLTLHMKYLGISVGDIGIQFAVSPVATLIATPLVGLLADKIGNFKIMLSVSLILCAAVSQLFLLVPSVETILLPATEAILPCNFTHPDWALSTSHLTQSEHLEECWTACLGSNSTGFQLCFSGSGHRACVFSNFSFEFKLSDPSPPGEFFYLNRTFSMAACSLPDNATDCAVRCLLARKTAVDPDSRAVTFWSYLAIRVGLFVAIATEMSLLKAAILTILDRVDSDYGFQRLWASVAVCLVPPLTGIIMDELKSGEVEVYQPCFYIYGGMKVFMAVIALIVDMEVKPPTLRVWKNLGKLLKNAEVDTLLFYCTFLGSCWGFLETFFLWFMEALGASKSLMGLTFTVGAVSGIPVTLVAGALTRRVGHVPLVVFGLFVYCGRFVGYSFVETPYQALGLEALECITMALMMITLTTYSNLLAGKELVATMQATWAALHFSVGRALGSVIGGFLIDRFGTRITYRIFSVSCIVMGIVYLLVYRAWFVKRHRMDNSKDDNVEEKSKLGKNVSLAIAKIVTENKKLSESDRCVMPPEKGNQKNNGKDNLGFESTNL